jgi:hypothetical protein
MAESPSSAQGRGMKRLACLLLLVTLLACQPRGEAVAVPNFAGVVVAVDGPTGSVEHYRLDTGASITVDRNTTIVPVRTTPKVAARDLLVGGTIPQGDWVMELGWGQLGGRSDLGCFALALPAFDERDSIVFVVDPNGDSDVPAPWRLRLPKAAGFGWQPGGLPRSDGSYRPNIFCLNGRGEVTGQVPR